VERQHYAAFQVLLILILFLVPTGITGAPLSKESTEDTLESVRSNTYCVDYDSVQKLIEVRCESIHLTDIYNSLKNPSILDVENDDDGNVSTIGANNSKVWVLNAGIVVDKESSLIIDSTDTSWLKITAIPTIQLKHKSSNITGEEADYSDDTATVIGTGIRADDNITNNITRSGNGIIIVSKNNGDNPNGIHVHGSLKIDSVKITSWDSEKKDVTSFDFGKRPGEEHTKSKYDTAEPRAFIRVSKDATGTTNITNSELAYLGYSCSRCSGLSYYGGEGSVIKDNNIHHLLKGFYSKNAGYITIDANKFHDNYLYGIDPHTGSHDLVIRDNLVYKNNASAIICSKHCYSILIEGNEVYNNTDDARGIAFSINTTKSVAKNNYIHDQSGGISFNRGSDHNAVYNNTILNCKTGVNLANTGNNSIYDNKISCTKDGITVQNVNNKIYNNKISLAKNGIVFEPMPYSNQTNDVAAGASPIDTVKDHKNYLTDIVDANHILDTKNPYVLEKQLMNSSVQIEQPNGNTTLR
jgi:mannuronan 5-epimerase